MLRRICNLATVGWALPGIASIALIAWQFARLTHNIAHGQFVLVPFNVVSLSCFATALSICVQQIIISVRLSDERKTSNEQD